MTTVVAAVSDLHIGSTIGLCTPQVQLDDGGYYKASKAQYWLWSCWKKYLERVNEVVEETKGNLVAVFNGDIIDGDHHDTHQLITRNENKMLSLAYDVTKPLVEASDLVYVIRGTPAHVGKSASYDEKFAEDIGAVGDKETGASSWWSLWCDVDGVTMDVAHHGRMGKLPWTKANSINRLCGEVILSYVEQGANIPHLVLRAHNHRYADSNDNFSTIRAIGMPGFQLATEYIHKINPGSIADIGGLIIVCESGKYSVEVVRFNPTRKRHKVRIS